MTDSKDIRFRKVKLSAVSNIKIEPDALKVLSLIDEKKTLTEIYREASLSKEAFKQCLVDLYHLKLIEKTQKAEPCLEGSFLDNMKEVLIDLLGPLGEVLMTDAAKQMSLDYPLIPISRVEEYVISVADEIPGDKQQISFKKAMLELIAKIK